MTIIDSIIIVIEKKIYQVIKWMDGLMAMTIDSKLSSSSAALQFRKQNC